MRILITLLFTLLLASCETMPLTFTTENIMKVHSGMGSEEILQLFGQPQNIRSAVCGREPNQWVCTTWEYGGAFPNARASFTFSGDHGAYVLNNFDIKRD